METPANGQKSHEKEFTRHTGYQNWSHLESYFRGLGRSTPNASRAFLKYNSVDSHTCRAFPEGTVVFYLSSYKPLFQKISKIKSSRIKMVKRLAIAEILCQDLLYIRQGRCSSRPLFKIPTSPSLKDPIDVQLPYTHFSWPPIRI